MKINQTIPTQQGQPQTMTIEQKAGSKNIYTVEDVQPDGTIVLKITINPYVCNAIISF
jgi:hypothetical protein